MLEYPHFVFWSNHTGLKMELDSFAYKLLANLDDMDAGSKEMSSQHPRITHQMLVSIDIPTWLILVVVVVVVASGLNLALSLWRSHSQGLNILLTSPQMYQIIGRTKNGTGPTPDCLRSVESQQQTDKHGIIRSKEAQITAAWWTRSKTCSNEQQRGPISLLRLAGGASQHCLR